MFFIRMALVHILLIIPQNSDAGTGLNHVLFDLHRSDSGSGRGKVLLGGINDKPLEVANGLLAGFF